MAAHDMTAYDSNAAPVCCGGGPLDGHAAWCRPTLPIVAARAAVGLPTRPRGTPNRVHVVDLDNGSVLVVPLGAP